MSAQDDKHEGALGGSWETNWSPPPLSKPPESPTPIEEAIYRLEHAMHWMWDNGQTGTARADASAIKDAREELATMRAAVERCAELEAALARVTAQLDEARRMARKAAGVAVRLNAIESMRRAALRATPTEGE